MHKTMHSLFILFLIAASTLMVGCGSSVPVIKPFKLDIQQGNVVTSKMLLQLRPGMTRSQVKFIMGTPLVVDSFHPNRWDYFYQMRQAGKVIEQRRVILDFENELLARVRGDVVPQGTPGAESGAAALSTESSAPVRVPPKEGLLENLKFWKSREPQIVKPAPQAEKTQPQSTIEAKPKAESAAPVKAVVPVVAPAAATAVTEEPNASIETPIVAPAESEAEPPSMLAVPIEIAPVQTEPAAIAPVQAEPSAIAPVIVNTPDAAPAAETSAEPAPTQSNPDERFIFRIDKQLNTQKIENNPTPQADTVKPAVNVDKAEPEEEYGYFERLLEKIGF